VVASKGGESHSRMKIRRVNTRVGSSPTRPIAELELKIVHSIGCTVEAPVSQIDFERASIILFLPNGVPTALPSFS
jgi:hypothetical protein